MRKKREDTMSTRKLTAVLAAAFVGVACQQGGPAASPSPSTEAMSDEQKTVYALGAALGHNVAPLKLNDAQLDTLAAGVRDAAKGATLKADPQEYQTQIQQLFQAKQAEAAQAEKARGKAYAETAAKEAGAVTLPSGLVYRTLQPGTGASPKATDIVTVHYTGTFVDGKEFDSSVKRGQPAEFQLNGVIRCWTEGVQRMRVGEKAKFVCPSEIAYGDQGRGPQMPGGATLVFEVELLGAKAAAPAKAAK
jgi:FKBP-type peptidyl-prolyl cis-trans isomerase FkpA